MVYLQVSIRSLQGIHCIHINGLHICSLCFCLAGTEPAACSGQNLLAVERDQVCYEGSHLITAVFIWALFLPFFCVGFPLWCVLSADFCSPEFLAASVALEMADVQVHLDCVALRQSYGQQTRCELEHAVFLPSHSFCSALTRFAVFPQVKEIINFQRFGFLVRFGCKRRTHSFALRSIADSKRSTTTSEPSVSSPTSSSPFRFTSLVRALC